MLTTVHTFLIHGVYIISSFLVHNDQLSEEAQEARNKDFESYMRISLRKRPALLPTRTFWAIS